MVIFKQDIFLKYVHQVYPGIQYSCGSAISRWVHIYFSSLQRKQLRSMRLAESGPPGGTVTGGLLPKVPQYNKPSSYQSAFKTTSYSNNPVPSNKYNPHGNATSSLPQINNSTTGLGAGSHGNNTNTSYLTGLTQHAWSTRHHKAAKVRKPFFFWWLIESHFSDCFWVSALKFWKVVGTYKWYFVIL